MIDSLVPTPEEQELIVLIKVRGHWQSGWDVSRVLPLWRAKGIDVIRQNWVDFFVRWDRMQVQR